MKTNIRKLCFCALGSALMAVGAWICIPGPVPFTMQTFVMFLMASCLGGKMASMSVGVYLLLGAVGLPVFSGFSGGIGALIGPTGGFLVGFIFMVWIAGEICRKRPGWQLAGMTLGLIALYILGTAWYCVYIHAEGMAGVWSALMVCVVPYIIPDAIKMALAYAVSRKIPKLW